MDLAAEHATELAGLVEIAKKAKAVSARLEKARADVAAREADIDAEIESLRKRRAGLRADLAGLQNASAKCSEAKSRILGKYVDRSALQARDKAQAAFNKADRLFRERQGRLKVARLDLKRKRRTLRREALSDWERRIGLEEGELALMEADRDQLAAALKAAQDKVDNAYKEILRGAPKEV